MACNVKPETWTITNRGRKQLNIFERKVYRRILGPVYDDEKENWRILTLRLLMSYIYIYIYGAPILDVSRSHTTTHHSR